MYNSGLILEGGGMRGVFTAGVLDFFIDKGIYFNHIYGVSAGSCHAASYLSRQRHRAFDVNVNYLDDKRYCSLHSLITTGDMFGAQMLFETIPDILYPYDHETFSKYRGHYHVVVTNCRTGRAEYPRIKDMRKDILWLRASCSLPVISRMVTINDHLYLDGGVADSIPICHSIKCGNEKNVLILTQPDSYRKSPNNMMPYIRIKYRHYPNLVRAMGRRHIIYNKTLNFVQRQEKQGRAFVIRPRKEISVGRLEKDKDKLKYLYQLGYDEANKCLEQLMNFLHS